MVNRNLLAATLLNLSDQLNRVRLHCPCSATELGSNRDSIDIISYNLMLSVQSCADIASHVIAGEGWPAATSLAEAFRRLSDQKVISSKTAEALGKATVLRNFVAHGYASGDPAMIHAHGRDAVTDMEAFASEVAGWLLRRKT